MSKLKLGLSALHFPVTMARYFWEAFERRDDVQVYSVGPYFDNWIPWNGGMTLPYKYVKVPYLPLQKEMSRMQVPYQAVVNEMPDDLDLFLTIDAGWHFATKPKAGINALIKTDPHVIPDAFYSVPAGYADFVFSMQSPYQKDGEFFLPYAYDPIIHYPEPDTEKIYDVCIIGLHYDQRSAVVTKLKNRGYNVYYGLGDVMDEYRHIYNQSKIAFSWSSRDDLCARNWEALAMGNLLVSNRVTDMQTFFVENLHYLGFDTVEEAISKIEWALNNPDKATEIADAGNRKVQGHTYDARAQQILEMVRLV